MPGAATAKFHLRDGMQMCGIILIQIAKDLVKHGYFLEEDVSVFDAPFFSMTAKEAAGMDPMKRLLLEVSYEGFENAGIPVDTLMNSQTGCYVGCMTNDYEQLSTHEIYDVGDVAASGVSEAMTANRVSWYFGLRGPSLTLDTACSSSLYALHLACQSLKLGETNMGLVAGVNLILHPNFMHQLSSMHMLSPEGISHSFDHRANGYGRGEGIGCLIVKRLKDALRDGDTIRAVIRGTGTNADGKTPGITQPSSEAQAELIKSTYEAAGLPFSDTQYFEAHGTGTPLGDPIELSAIGATLGTGRDPESGPLFVGSIKANVGHTEGCSGLAGVLKSIVCLEKGILVPTAGIEKVNPKLRLTDWNLALPSENMSWPSKGQRRISVNSFGFGGANAHVILDDAHNYLRTRGLLGNHNTTTLEDDSSESGISMGSESPRQESHKRLFAFSTKDQTGIDRLGPLFTDFLSNKEAMSNARFLGDLAYTLAGRRSHFEFRSFAVAESVSDLQTQIEKGLPKSKRASKHDNPIFIFTGQGAQWPAMGRELLNNCIFRTSVHKSQVLLEHYGCPWDLIDELSKTSDSNVDLPQYSQVLCTVLQIALVDLVRAWGVIPKAVVGHSSGEIGAAYAAGLISRCNAVKVAYLRGICSAKVADIVSPRVGAMLAAGLSEVEAAAYLDQVPPGSAVVACVNSPSSVTLSGDRDSISQLCELISADGKFARMLRVKTAYHSPHMSTVAKEYVDRMGVILPLADEDQVAPMFSSLTGNLVSSRDLDGSYWMKNMCEQVRFSQAMSNLLEHSSDASKGRSRNRTAWSAFIEIGPHGALQSPVGEIVKASHSKAAKEAPYFSAITRGKNAESTSLQLAGQLWASGHAVNLLHVNGIIPETLPMALPDLPSYPWNHSKSYWHESTVARSNRFPSGPRTDLLGVAVEMQNPMEPRWRNYLRISENPWIEDHRITGTTLYPAAGMIVMAMEAAQQLADPERRLRGINFQNLKFERGLVVPSRDQAVQTEVNLRPDDSIPSTWSFTVYSTVSVGSWTKHCYGSLTLDYENDTRNGLGPSETEWRAFAVERQDIEQSASEELDMDSFYDDLESVGVEYGPTFRNVFQAAAVPGEHTACGSIAIPDTKSVMPSNFEFPHLIHPATMDAIFHLLFIAFTDGKPLEEAAVPYTLKHMYVSTNLPRGDGSVYTGYAKRLRTDGRETSGDLIVSDEDWSAPKLIVRDFALRQVTSSRDASSLTSESARRVCAKLRWKEDFDFLRGPVALQGSPSFADSGEVTAAVLQLLNRMYHKKPNYKALIVVADTTDWAQRLLQNLLHPFTTASEGNVKSTNKLALATTTKDASRIINCLPKSSQHVINAQEWPAQDDEPLPFSHESFDLLLVLDDPSKSIHSSAGFHRLHEALQPKGYLGVIGPILTPDSSGETVKDTSASGLQTRIAISEAESCRALALSQKSPASKSTTVPEHVFLLHRAGPALPQDLQAMLTARLNALGCQVHPVTLEQAHDLREKHVISVLEVESPLVYSWTSEEFLQFKSLVSGASHLFWVTRGGELQNWDGGLEFAPSQGLLRVMRTEYSHITLPHLDLSRGGYLSSEASADVIMSVWHTSLADDSSQLELEYAELNGTIFVPRFVEDEGIDIDLGPRDQSLKPIMQALGDDNPRTLSEQDHRLVWVDDDMSASLASAEVEINAEYLAVQKSSADSSETQTSVISAMAVTGTITAASPEVTSVNVGQRVIALHSGSCHTMPRIQETLVRVLPDTMQPEEACETIPALVAAQYALSHFGRLEDGQTVLIHGGETSVGQMAAHLARLLGATAFVTVEGASESRNLTQALSLDSTRIFEDISDHCKKSILRQTDGRGVDLILNCRQALPTSTWFECLADFGFFIDIGGKNASHPVNTSPARNATVVKASTSQLIQAKPTLVSRLFKSACDLIESGQISPIIPSVIRSISEFTNFGDAGPTEFVLRLDSDDKALVAPSRLPELRLDSDATYILAGGLGALGLQIAEMMFEHGAGHVVFLSRSGGDKAQAELGAFRERGLKVDALKCDVSDAAQVEAAVRALIQSQRRIKGVIQCAMVLEDAIFENMTYDQWQRSTRPKIQGTMNLHNYMPKDVNFFILLSSITCVIGNAAQSNYAAGNTFEDAFAHYRRSKGLAATAIDVGLVTDSAHFTGDFDMDAYLQMYEHRWDGLQTTQKELDTVLRAAMRGRTADGRQIEPQIVLGLGSSMPTGAAWTRDPKFSHRVNHDASASSGASESQQSASERIAKAETLADAALIFEDVLKTYAAQVMDIAPSEVDPEKAFYDFGVDSLKAVELRNRIFRDLQSDMSVFELLSPSPLSRLALEIASRSKLMTNMTEKATAQ
ncbi:Reducing polyketide synthase FUB1 [Colletotrichum siamense]|uniref:Reducing polyketide synthase FUB1 n=1 Tax=Colletotrichum siamense TaxID=690259 RepID=A0A9P5K3N9_COLSI|nr:Reducing polyketide synthase FUB1 [Colletotrichum siamense]KAF4858509.1 Reducing polyketide synthase FUB1 [Colletotrichum siamense]